jgi:hypothetical protein
MCEICHNMGRAETGLSGCWAGFGAIPGAAARALIRPLPGRPIIYR